MATIKVVIVEPGVAPRYTEMDNSDLKSYQDIVGGYIRGVFADRATVYVNEEGLIRALPFNPLATQFAQRVLGVGVVLHGPALFVGPPDGEGNDTDVHQFVVDYYTVEV